MNAPLRPWPVSMFPDFTNCVRMSDGTLRRFSSYGRAAKFLEQNPTPTAREQLAASLEEPDLPETERQARWDDQVEREENDRAMIPAEEE